MRRPRQSPRSAPYGSQSRPIAPATIDRALAPHLDWPPDNCIRRERTWPRTPSSNMPLTTPSTLLDGVGIFYEVFGPRSAGRSLVFLPTWSIVHSRIWMAQVPYFARHGFRVLVFDGRGNGRSGRPATGYRTDDFVQDTLSVLDAVGIKTAVLVGISDGAKWGIQMAAEHPGRVSDLVLIGPSARLSGSQRKDLQSFFSEPVDRDGWNKYNAVYWQRDYRGFLEFFCSQVISQPHSTKQIEDQIKWGLETTPEVLIATEVEGATPQMAEFVANVRCPVLIVHGTNDAIYSVIRRGSAARG